MNICKNLRKIERIDKIYYQTAVFHLRDGSDSLATTYYNKALRTPTQDKLLRAHAYETLGNMNFDKAEYKIAGAYYDSTMNNLTTKEKLILEAMLKN